MLHIISTPIGNLKDITYRAIELLGSVDLVAAEDTRRTGKLLKAYSISTKLASYNDINKKRMTPHLIKLLKEGKDIAIVSDAGTPGINDPAFYIVREAASAGIQISPVPGPCAAIAALVASGCPTDSFGFYGFLPKKTKKMEDFLRALPEHTVICYESCYSVKKTLEIMNRIIPERKICVAREITKMHEEFIRGTPCEVLERLKTIKGEFVVLISKPD